MQTLEHSPLQLLVNVNENSRLTREEKRQKAQEVFADIQSRPSTDPAALEIAKDYLENAILQRPRMWTDHGSNYNRTPQEAQMFKTLQEMNFNK